MNDQNIQDPREDGTTGMTGLKGLNQPIKPTPLQ